MEAVKYAANTERPLNRHCTIHWESGGVPDALAAAATAAFLKSARDWLRTRGQSTAFAWVREDGPDKGGHAHILMHVPPAVAPAFVRRQRRWVRLATGHRYRAKVLHSRRIGGPSDKSDGTVAAYVENLAKVVAYVLKGASAQTGLELGLERLEPGGSITGKRVGWSENIGGAARRRAGR